MKIRKILLLIILPLLFVVTGCKNDNLDNISKDLNTYTMDITYNNDYTLDIKETLKYQNTSDDTLDNLEFHLYPRNFREDSKCSVVSNLNYSKCYYNGNSYGDMEIILTKENGTEKEFTIKGADEDILSIELSTPLRPNEWTEIYIESYVTLPNINHRFGYGENTINLGNFYPIVCMYENKKFIEDSYHYNGDPFYSDMANYNVTLSANNNLIVASSGEITNTTKGDDTTKYTIQGKVIRDFAIVLSANYNTLCDNINGTKVIYHYYNNQYPNEALQAGIDSVRTFEKLFGDYPYSTLTIVESNFVHGGMEYPNLVLISDAVTDEPDYLNVIIHECAHQWWYGIVGNNEYNYGWLDEGLTEYSTLLFYEENSDYNVDKNEVIKNSTNSYVNFVDIYTKVFGSCDTSMNRPLDEYTNESEYVYIAYVKGMLIFDSLDEVLGHEKFIKCLQTYFEENKYGIATPNTLISAFEKCSKRNLNSLFDSWINGKIKIISIGE